MQIARALDPSVHTPAGTTPGRSTTDFDVSLEPESCWVDHVVWN